jgi:hypothetical protein
MSETTDRDRALLDHLAGEVHELGAWLMFSFCPTHGISTESMQHRSQNDFIKDLLRTYAERVGELEHFAGIDYRRKQLGLPGFRDHPTCDPQEAQQ